MSMIITAKDNDKIKYTKSLLKSKNSLSLLTDFLSVKILLTEIMINYKCERFTICFLYDKMQE